MRCDVVRGSHLDLFDRCQLAYRYTVHDRKIPDIKMPKWAILGFIMHKVFEIVVNEGGDPHGTLIHCMRNYRKIGRDEWASSYPDVPIDVAEIPELSRQSFERAMIMIRNFGKFFKVIDAADARETEVPFQVALDVEGSIMLRGRIDLVLTTGDGLAVVDYKSSKIDWEHKVVPPQLLRYAIALSITRNVPISKVETILFNLESGRVLRRSWTPEEANALVASVVRKVEDIRAVEASAATPTIGSHCRNLCQYHLSCPAYRACK